MCIHTPLERSLVLLRLVTRIDQACIYLISLRVYARRITEKESRRENLIDTVTRDIEPIKKRLLPYIQRHARGGVTCAGDRLIMDGSHVTILFLSSKRAARGLEPLSFLFSSCIHPRRVSRRVTSRARVYIQTHTYTSLCRDLPRLAQKEETEF